MTNIISLSVHDLVDFILRKGNIDDRYFNKSTMQEGTSIHIRYQNSKKSNYFKEVFLSKEILYKDYIFNIFGRCDGLILNKIPIIEEIKSTNYDDLELFYNENKEWHLGQAQVYALIYLLNNNLDKIKVKLTYISQNNYKNKIYKIFTYSKDELSEIVNEYFNIYLSFYLNNLNYQNALINSVNSFKFPYSNIRNGQLDIVNLVSKCIKNNERIFIEASTGLGKTVSILYGAIQGFKNKKIDKIFYLTAKNSGFNSAHDQIKYMISKGLILKSSFIYAKEKICINKEKCKCNPDFCIYAKNYYSKLKDILSDALLNFDIFDDKTYLYYADKYQVCPFELSLDLSNYSSLLVCDYNYTFNPISYLKRYYDSDNNYKICYLVDEAHNLASRSREMFSTDLSLFDIESALKEIKKNKILKKLFNKIDKLYTYFKEIYIQKNENVYSFDLLEDDLYMNLLQINEIGKEYNKKDLLSNYEECNNLLLKIYQFITIYELINNNFKIYYEKNKNNLILNIFCLDASNFIHSKVMNSPTVFFSGTLTPNKYYQKIILGDDNYKYFYFESPYNPNNLKIFIDDKTSLFYKDRSSTINHVVYEISKFISFNIGNYIIFCPSFEYLQNLKKYFVGLNYNLFFQGDNDDKFIEKNKFFDFFKRNSEMNLAFCVLGGSYSESIDLKNGIIDGEIIIGTGLPSINIRNNFIKEFYDKNNINGFDFAYTNPGINKIFQAIGRIIRGENDKGIVFLIDKRYSYKYYKEFIESKFKNNLIIKNDLDQCIKHFIEK